MILDSDLFINILWCVLDSDLCISSIVTRVWWAHQPCGDLWAVLGKEAVLQSLTRAVFYMVMQCLGAICGAGVVKGYQKTLYESNGGGANVVNPG